MLNKIFLENAEKMLKEEFSEFLHHYDLPPYRGVRLNTLKCDEDTLFRTLPFNKVNTPFSHLSFYAPHDFRAGGVPAHHAGMFYSQEPSASSAVSVLSPEKGEKILDLCAAPGGKSTQIGAYLSNTGLLWSNEIVSSRAAALASNIERMGMKNAVVSSCHPEKLCSALGNYFDRVLVDAPCSGEGMFRHDPTAVEEWTPESPSSCAKRQAEILDSAAKALKKDGILVYSTCTFSIEENENAVKEFLSRHSEFELVEIDVPFGRKAYDGKSLRIFPMDGGEGHFVAKMIKRQGLPSKAKAFSYKNCNNIKEAEKLYTECFTSPVDGYFYSNGKTVNVIPEGLPELSGLGVIRAGYEFCEQKEKRLEISHGAFMCRKKEECRSYIDLPFDSNLLKAYYHGEEIECDNFLKGYTAVCVEGITTGFGKAVSGRLKNKYPKGLRTNI